MRGINKKILMFFLLVIPAILGWYLLERTKNSIVSNVNREISQTTQIIAFEQESWINRTEQLFQVLASIPEITSGDPEKCSGVLAKINRIYPRYVNLGVLKPNGELFCSAVPFVGKFTASGLPWFERTLTDKTFTIGEFQIGKLVKKPAIPFGFPIVDERGEVKYVLAAGLDLAWLSKLIQEVKLEPASQITVIDRNGIVLAQFPEKPAAVGQKLPEGILLKTILRDQTGTLETVGQDGVRRIYAFTSLSGELPGVFFILGIPYHFVYDQLRAIVWPSILIILVTAAVVFSIAWYFFKRKKGR